MSGRVFVVQNQHFFDRTKGQYVPKFDMTPAEEFGRLVYLLSPTASPFRPESIIEELRIKLHDFGPGDHLLLVGNPVLIGLATAIAASMNRGRVSLLQWSGKKEQRYIAVEARGLFTS